MRILSAAAAVAMSIAVLASSSWAAPASLRTALRGKTLLCDGAIQIRFNARGSRATLIGPIGSAIATLRWRRDRVEFLVPGAQDYLSLERVGPAYRFQGAACR